MRTSQHLLIGLLARYRPQWLNLAVPRRKSKKATGQTPALADAASGAKSAIEDQMGLLRFLVQNRQFDQSGLEEYFNRAEQIGMDWTSQDKRDMFRDATLLVPKRQSDGTILNGYGQVRVVLIETHAQTVSKGIRTLSQLLQLQALDAAITRTYMAYIEEVAKELQSLARLA